MNVVSGNRKEATPPQCWLQSWVALTRWIRGWYLCMECKISWKGRSEVTSSLHLPPQYHPENPIKESQPGPHVAMGVQRAVGELNTVEGYGLPHPVGTSGRRIRVNVDTVG